MISDCFVSYLSRPGGVKPYDVQRVGDLNEYAGVFPLKDAARGWQAWLHGRGAGQKPTSVQRWRNTFQAAINHGAAAHGTTAPKLPPVKGGSGTERAIYLTDDERRRLLAAYNPHAACPVLLLAYQGMRTQEALQLDWRRVNFGGRTIFLPADETKAERARTVPMHPRVDALLFGMWCVAGRPVSGLVFLSARGVPYADTRGRGTRAQGGNPLAQAHETACRRAGITGFRVHDLRHDWAHRMVMSGCDLRTLMDLGGWSSLRMVQRYAAGSPGVAVEAIGRLR
jgi:integrase